MVRGILGLVKKHQQQERIIRVSGAPLQTDPAQWKHDMEVTCTVGLGTGNRDQIMTHLMALLSVQQQIVAAQGGINGPLVYGKNLYDTVAKISDNAGFRTNFAITDPTVPPPPSVTGPPKPPQPDPQTQLLQMQAQAEIQIQQQKAQSDAQLNAQKGQHQAQLSAQKAQQDMQISQQQMQHQQSLNEQKLQHDFAIQQAKANAEMDIERLRAQNDMAVERLKADNAHQLAMHQANLAAQQPANTSS